MSHPLSSESSAISNEGVPRHNPSPTETDLLVEHHDAVMVITINRPHARNAMTEPMYDRLEQLFDELKENDSVRAVVITGAGGKAFASGTDLAELQKIRSPEQAMAYEKRGARLMRLLADCPLPTLAAIDGACVGGGLAIAAACDLRVAAANAKIGMPIARTTGNCLSLASCRLLASLVGPSRVKRMIYTAELWDAEQAERYGFVDDRITDPEARALPRALEMAQQIAGHAPLTIRATKTALNLLRDGGDPEREQAFIEEVYGSQDFAEGVAAFLEKRKPVWQGR